MVTIHDLAAEPDTVKRFTQLNKENIHKFPELMDWAVDLAKKLGFTKGNQLIVATHIIFIHGMALGGFKQ